MYFPTAAVVAFNLVMVACGFYSSEVIYMLSPKAESIPGSFSLQQAPLTPLVSRHQSQIDAFPYIQHLSPISHNGLQTWKTNSMYNFTYYLTHFNISETDKQRHDALILKEYMQVLDQIVFGGSLDYQLLEHEKTSLIISNNSMGPMTTSIVLGGMEALVSTY